MTLRSKVIRLAHERPELRAHLLPLVAAGNPPRDRKQQDQAEKALNALLKHLDTPLKKWVSFGSQSEAVPVPADRKSEWKSLDFKLVWGQGGMYAQLDQVIRLVGGGGTRERLGDIFWSAKNEKWGWRDKDGKEGYV